MAEEDYANADQALDRRGRWIWFRHRATGPRTLVWSVLSLEGEVYLGSVCWSPAWRKYEFLPEAGIGLEEVCLRDIAQFLVERTREHRARRNRGVLESSDAPEPRGACSRRPPQGRR
jgi:hypothetical protein